MPTDYTEQDTERARAAERERSSAGSPTTQLGELPQTYSGPAGWGTGATALPARRNNLPGLILIGIGVALLAGRLLQSQLELTGGLVLLTIASVFLFFSFWKRIYGLLIPGAILAGLSVGVTFADLSDGVSVLWGLALGFLSIMLLGRTLFGVRSPWAAIPAAILFGVGTIVAIANAPAFLGLGLVWLPLGLIGAGLFLGWGRRS
jgi:hypothetical protein